ncbi:hypothetical protein HIM_08896 [Hirsutella minnesotensis 3608]|uniref:Zn(2)-C6 fungal-type domain-containing protein n=1 Tax=Hirsutella minnesotensis 3608 TaxID=1043627 RepID=A0A0F8A3E7_9HYPO|nr:hypothetical protein HIM_08896 [Hirsutella minnesotensis 3608]
MGDSPQETGHNRSACTECQRRKQKCNRVWPCNHCQKRKVADKCHFGQGPLAHDKTGGGSVETGRKRQLSHEDITDSSDTNPWDDGESGFEALGYTASHLFSGLLSLERRVKSSARKQTQDYMEVASCPQLERTLHVLPPRPYTDSLVQNFLNNVNYHYYIIYPPSFLDDYRAWWASRSENKPLSLQWTCLLLMVCACSAQYTDVELQHKLENDLNATTKSLAECYHHAARELHSVIPVGNNHLLSVQSLLHSCYWYKSKGRFIECWHVLSAAIREAQELGINQEHVTGPLSEFEHEMRRRVWCILDTWDWQISALLSRPVIIDRTECQVGLPNLKLEGYSPSPLLHMKLLSELITQLARRFGVTKNVITPAEVREYQAMIETWMSTFPPTYAFEHPDQSADAQRPWIVLHRHQLHTMAYSMLLEPIRPYLARPMTANTAPAELQIRSNGIDYCLRLMSALYAFFNHVYPRDAKYHYVLFCIFDLAAILCSTVMHDEDKSTPRRDEILGAIDGAVAMLRRLNDATKMAKASYDVLLRVSQRVIQSCTSPPPDSAPNHARRRKMPMATGLAVTPPSATKVDLAQPNVRPPNPYVAYNTMHSKHGVLVSHSPSTDKTSPDPIHASPPLAGPAPLPNNSMTMEGPMVLASSPIGPMGVHEHAQPATYLHMTPPTEVMYQPLEFGNITQQELGDLATLWNYESLNLDFISPQT